VPALSWVRRKSILRHRGICRTKTKNKNKISYTKSTRGGCCTKERKNEKE